MSNAGTITTLTNGGTIRGGGGVAGKLGGAGGAGGAGVANSVGIATLANSGAISGGSGGSATFIGATGGAGVSNASGAMIGSLNNATGATIGGGSGGASLQRAGAGDMGGAGGAGVTNAGAITTLTNLRYDQRRGRRVRTYRGRGRRGDMELGRHRIARQRWDDRGRPRRKGLPSGAAGDAIYSAGAHASIGPITNSGSIIGNVAIDNQASVTVTGGAGTTFGSWTGGTITIGAGNLTFAGGNTALGDDIAVNGSKGTVTNQGPLQIAALAPLAIAGNFTQALAGALGLDFAGDSPGNTARLRSAGARASTAASGST